MKEIVSADSISANIEDLSEIVARQLPSNISAEQVLLGAILNNNEILNIVSEFLSPDYFLEPVHQRIYQSILMLVERGMLASPITLKNQFDKDESLVEMGGSEYLHKLVTVSATIINPLDYAKVINDLAIRRKLISIGEDVVNDAYDKEIEVSAHDQIEMAEQSLFELASEGTIGRGFQSFKQSLAESIGRVENAFKNKERITGISTGFTDLDKLLSGFNKSDLVILAARPSMGKTALAINMAVNACEALKRLSNDNPSISRAVGYFSLEMSSEQLASRILSMYSNINSHSLRSGFLNEKDFEKIIAANAALQDMQLFIDDTPALSISAVRARARRLKRRHNISILFVDYLQLMRSVSKNRDSNRVNEVSEITQGLKAIAKELDIPVVAMSQLSRAVEQREDKHPQLSDLRESGSIEQDADIVMFIYREEYYIGRSSPPEGTAKHLEWQEKMDKIRNLTEIIVAKHRNGPIGKVVLHFDSNTTKFSNHSDHHLSYAAS